MDWFRVFARRIRMLLHRDQTSSEFAEEMQLHLDLRRQEQIESGLTAREARATAHRRFGNPTLLREQNYTAWGWTWLENLAQDILYGLRAMLHSPGITLVALLSLALGIGANTAIFSLMDAVMLRSLPVNNPQELVLLGTANDRGFESGFDVTDILSYPFYRQLQQSSQSFSSVGAMLSLPNDVHGYVQGHSEAESLHVQLVSGTYFSTLGVSAALGRVILQADDAIKNRQPVAVISDAWWERSLGRDASVLGRTIRLGTTDFQIVGVAPPEFFGTRVGDLPDLWVPLSMMQEIPPHWNSYGDPLSQCLFLFGRLKSDVSITQATTEVNLLRQQILPNFPGADMNASRWADLRHSHIPLTPMAAGFSDLRSEFSQPLKILMGIAVLVLLIACANIANLLLARSTARTREFAVRQALGARRTRLVRQLFTESLLLATFGGLAGILLAQAAARLLLRLVSGGLQTVPLDISLSTRMLFFTLALSVATSLFFGMLPALRATHFDLSRSLKDGQSMVRGKSRGKMASALIISQISFSVVLLVAASLFLHSLVNLTHVDTGFNREDVIRLDIDPGSAGYAEKDPRLPTLYSQIEDRVAHQPGIRAASVSAFTFHEGAWFTPVDIPGSHTGQNVTVIHNIIGNDYFAAMQIPLLAGRAFRASDTATSQKVAVISEHMARVLFPGGSAVGRHYIVGPPKGGNDIEVVGVAKDAKFGSLDEKTEAIDYIPYTQHNGYLGDFEARYTGDPGAASASIMRAIHQVDRNLPISHVTTLDEQVSRSYTDQSLVAQLSTFFGLLAVFLSAIGIYGLMSYMVSRRTNEIGIRMALGAERMHVRWLVIREILVLVAVGIAIGVPAALLANRLVASMLFGLSARDPLSLLAAIGVMLAIAALAGYLPARRASRVDPMVALRYE